MQPITIVDYREDWPAIFLALHEGISNCIGSLTSAIEHVGSTSVPGLSGKDKIDVSVVVIQNALLPVITKRLEGIGYIHRGNLGIDGREVFEPHSQDPAHNLYVCTAGMLSLRNHLTLRDHLRTHPTDAAAYADLKRKLAEQFPFDRAAYISGKTEFILTILAKNGFSNSELDAIREANAKVCLALEDSHPRLMPLRRH